MEEVVKFAKKALETMSSCAAIRATTQEFIDVPRAELKKALVEGCKLNPATVNTQIQRGRMDMGADKPAKPAKAAKPAAADAGGVQEAFDKMNAKKNQKLKLMPAAEVAAAAEQAAPAAKKAAAKKPAAKFPGTKKAKSKKA